MDPCTLIDVRFDFHTESRGKDPDFASPTLRKYHALLWSRSLTSGASLAFDSSRPRSEGYLVNISASGPSMVFGSDAITHSYSYWTRPASLANAIRALDQNQRERYLEPPYTIGSSMIWPVKKEAKPTINQARGTRPRIDDRIDLTLECIRRHYLPGMLSPLSDVLEVHRDFFSLFDGFAEFIDFFLLHDLVTADSDAVRFFLPLDDFSRRGSPRSLEEYIDYREAVLDFIAKRQQRIARWAQR